MEVANFYGYSIGIGVIVSAIIELLKFTKVVPVIGHFAPIKALVDFIEKGKPDQIRISVAAFCVVLNLISFFWNGGLVTDAFQLITMISGSFSSFLSALGTFNFLFEQAEQKKD